MLVEALNMVPSGEAAAGVTAANSAVPRYLLPHKALFDSRLPSFAKRAASIAAVDGYRYRLVVPAMWPVLRRCLLQRSSRGAFRDCCLGVHPLTDSRVT
jgi:hypothetical protein